MIADDAPEIRAVVRFTLQSQGWIVYEAPTPAAALEVAGRERPDAVVLDVIFRGHTDDGYSVCRSLRTAPATSAVPIVMLTARSSAADRDIANAIGATAYLPKPFRPMELLSVLRGVLGVRASIAPLGVLLMDDGRIHPEQLETVLEEQRRLQTEGIKLTLGEMLKRRGKISAADVERALERQRAAAKVAATTPREMRVLIADGHIAVRDGLRAIFDEESGFEIVGVAADGEEALRLLRERRPDVAVLDQSMPKRTGLDVLAAMRREGLTTAVVIFSLDDRPRDQARAAGAAFITKDADPRALVAEVRRAGGGVPVTEIRSTVSWARAAPAVAWHAVARQRRAAGIIGVAMVGYAGAFLVAESVLGASAALLSIASVGLAGALLGPEAGVLVAVLAAFETVLLWNGTGYLVGEPVLVVGGNNLGFLALIGIGAGFGAMRLLHGRVDPRGRQVEALIESALLIGNGDRRTLELVTEAAHQMTSSDAVLLYAVATDGRLEVVATAGAPRSMVGHREARGAGPLYRVLAEARPATLGDLDARSFLPSMHSAVVVPVCPIGERPRGLLIAFSKRGVRLEAADTAALLSLAPSACLALKSSSTGRHQSDAERASTRQKRTRLANRADDAPPSS
ncbi:MAG: response regulator [Candidatus Limnocylindria bacterium]